MNAADLLGQQLAAPPAGRSDIVSAQIVDVTEDGLVNLDIGGTLVTDVSCPDHIRGRAPGQWVAVRMGARPVVMWRLGPDPGQADEATVRTLANEVALDVQVVRAATWGTSVPAGSGWQTVTQLYLRKNSEGKVELYGQLGAETDPSPTAPAGTAPKPVTISPSSFGSWRGGRPDDYVDYPMQGDWTGGGNRRGGWFYGNAISSACAGKTVSRMDVTFTRRRGSGVNASRPLHLYLHDHTSAPSGQLDLDEGPEELMSLSVGATRTVALPSSWRSQLASGAAKGLAIYATGSRDYMAVSGGKIKITFSA
jgi:hypothetical protein